MKKNSFPFWILYIAAMLFLVMNGKAAMHYAGEGINLCVQSVIPSLFPFIFLSNALIAKLNEIHLPAAQSLCKMLRIPVGGELLLLLGYVGGYPIGAQNIYESYNNGFITIKCAKRMLIFCNNAGPAFIFGIVATQFESPVYSWIIWTILTLSSVATAILLPCTPETGELASAPRRNFPNPIVTALKAAGNICGWVILFRVLFGFVNRWLLQSLPTGLSVLVSGLLELTNGCLQLDKIQNEFARIAVASFLLSTGGLCVTLQTLSAVGKLGSADYLVGKLLQGCISYLLCVFIQPFLFPGAFQSYHIALIAASIIIGFLCLWHFRKSKECSRFSGKSIVYCQKRTNLRGKKYAV